MKKSPSIIAFCLILAGCASTPDEVLMSGNHFQFASQKSPRNAAQCLSKSSNNISPALISTIQDGDKKHTYQTVVNSVRGDGGTVIVFISSPSAQGTTIDAYITGSMLFTGGKEKFALSIADNCR